MANPLACSAALTSIELLLESDWQAQVKRIETGLRQGLAPCVQQDQVEDVRVLGAIGVVELKHPVDMKRITEAFVNAGVWLRPFGRLVYLMPPYVISDEDLSLLARAVVRAAVAA
jgi:adenosylmethionine-8-amino-7-oxononanoate aminotransferase